MAYTRDIDTWDWFKDQEDKQLFIAMLGLAAFADHQTCLDLGRMKRQYNVYRGEIVSTYRQLAGQLGTTPRKLERMLPRFEASGHVRVWKLAMSIRVRFDHYDALTGSAGVTAYREGQHGDPVSSGRNGVTGDTVEGGSVTPSVTPSSPSAEPVTGAVTPCGDTIAVTPCGDTIREEHNTLPIGKVDINTLCSGSDLSVGKESLPTSSRCEEILPNSKSGDYAPARGKGPVDQSEIGIARDKHGNPYRFAGRYIRINAEDYALWERKFDRVNIDACLFQCDDWIHGEILDGKLDAARNWFHRASAWLQRAQVKLADGKALELARNHKGSNLNIPRFDKGGWDQLREWMTDDDKNFYPNGRKFFPFEQCLWSYWDYRFAPVEARFRNQYLVFHRPEDDHLYALCRFDFYDSANAFEAAAQAQVLRENFDSYGVLRAEEWRMIRETLGWPISSHERQKTLPEFVRRQKHYLKVEGDYYEEQRRTWPERQRERMRMLEEKTAHFRKLKDSQ